MFDRCPRYGETLRAGFLRSGSRNILWSPFDGWRISYHPIWEGERSLQEKRLGSGVKLPAQRCEHCGLILIETKEEST
ncbi:PF20097 family protein [uncultured Oscillibacter sp.]|uniref:PF20097 family protein n=1 Tax=uncultured Oscillibacter sp. TaxID=876091 RepID=UPI0025FDCE82|nr:PF20097 family protein [uncultured Oscillibacter sp.]